MRKIHVVIDVILSVVGILAKWRKAVLITIFHMTWNEHWLLEHLEISRVRTDEVVLINGCHVAVFVLVKRLLLLEVGRWFADGTGKVRPVVRAHAAVIQCYFKVFGRIAATMTASAQATNTNPLNMREIRYILRDYSF